MVTDHTADAAKLLPLTREEQASGIRDWCEGTLKLEKHECRWPKCNCSDIPLELFGVRQQPAPPAGRPVKVDPAIWGKIAPTSDDVALANYILATVHDGNNMDHQAAAKAVAEWRYTQASAAPPEGEPDLTCCSCGVSMREPNGACKYLGNHPPGTLSPDALRRWLEQRAIGWGQPLLKQAADLIGLGARHKVEDAEVAAAIKWLSRNSAWPEDRSAADLLEGLHASEGNLAGRLEEAEARAAKAEADLAKAQEIMQHFVNKCDAGLARSVETYGHCKEWLDHHAARQQQKEPK